ncbi:DHHW family protein [Butyrivibrio fibrisolvens]|uniref:DHHW family protein n=1 Tax=Butyrivibrio fibrisolvens TaxID=831 RepID=UPI0003B41C06|nr:DHHW family protein [Butyrivibrio fibrisolvens]
MRKFNANSILFVFAMAIIFSGIFGKCIIRVAADTVHIISAMACFDVERVELAKNSIDNASSELLSYHDTMMDIDSIRNNVLGTRVVYKDDTTVIKSETDSLIEVRLKKDDEEIGETVSRVKELEDIAEENGAHFLYCAVPTKSMFTTAPGNITDFSAENYKQFISSLNDANVPVLDFYSMMSNSNNNVIDTDYYYRTDHHWKVECGFQAAGILCEELSNRYGFSYNKLYTDIKNYNITTFYDWFLGSYGKKVGTFFTWYGADDFSLVTPNFSTNLVVEDPLNNQKQEGSFEETLLCLEDIEKRDYYGKNPYGAYSGGDYRLQIVKNNLNPEGKKIIIIRDSFACVVTPFLSLQTKELHICDMRDFIPGEKMNMADYICEQKPDYVIVFFSGVNGIEKGGRYDFF